MVEHECLKAEQIKSVSESLKSIKHFKFGSVIAVFVLVLGAIAQFYGFKNTVDTNSAALSRVEKSINYLTKSQQKVEKQLIIYEERDKIARSNAIGHDLKTALEEFLTKESKDKKKKK